MPIYEYECEQCSMRFERLQRMADATLTDCPECNGHVHRVMQPVGVIFKGSGFYQTDYRSSDYHAAAKKDSGAAESKPSTESKTEKAEKKETKPAAGKIKEITP